MEFLEIKPAVAVSQRHSDQNVRGSQKGADVKTNLNAEEKSRSNTVRRTRIPVKNKRGSPSWRSPDNYSASIGDSGIGTSKKNASSANSAPKHGITRIPVNLLDRANGKESPYKRSLIPLRKVGDRVMTSDSKSEGHADASPTPDTLSDKVHVLKYAQEIVSPESSVRSFPRSARFSVDTDGTSGNNIKIANLETMSYIPSSEKITALYDSIVVATNKIKAANESISKWLNDEFKRASYNEPRTSSTCQFCVITEKSRHSVNTAAYRAQENVAICLTKNNQKTTSDKINDELSIARRNFKDIPIVRMKSKTNRTKGEVQSKVSRDTENINKQYATLVALEDTKGPLQGVNKDFQYPSSAAVNRQDHVPSYTVCPSEVLQKTTNFECCESLTNSSPRVDLEVRENFSSQFTMEHPDEYTILDAWCPHSCLSHSYLSYMKCPKYSKDKNGVWSCREHNDGCSEATTKDSCHTHTPRSSRYPASDDHSKHVVPQENVSVKKLSSKKYDLRQFKCFRWNRSKSRQQHQRRWIHVWKKKTKWSNWSRGPFKFRKFRMLHSLQRSVIWEDADVQTNILVFREVGTGTVPHLWKSAANVTSANFSSHRNSIDKAKHRPSFRFRSQFKHINRGPSRFPFNHNTNSKMKTSALSNKTNAQSNQDRDTVSISADTYKQCGFLNVQPKLSNKVQEASEKVHRSLSPIAFEKEMSHCAICTDSTHTRLSLKEIATSAISIQSTLPKLSSKIFQDTFTEPITDGFTDHRLVQKVSVGVSNDMEKRLLNMGQSYDKISLCETVTQVSQATLPINQSVGILQKISTDNDETQIFAAPSLQKISIGLNDEFQKRCPIIKQNSSDSSATHNDITVPRPLKMISTETFSINYSENSARCVVDTGQSCPMELLKDNNQKYPKSVTVKNTAVGRQDEFQKPSLGSLGLTRTPKSTAILPTSQSSLVESIYQPFVFEVGTMSSIHEQKSVGILTSQGVMSNKSVANFDLQPKIISATTSTRRLTTSTKSTGRSANDLKNVTFDVYVQFSTHQNLGKTSSREIQTDREIKSAAVLTSSIAIDKATEPDQLEGTCIICACCGKQGNDKGFTSQIVTQTSQHVAATATQCTSNPYVLAKKSTSKTKDHTGSHADQLTNLTRLITKPAKTTQRGHNTNVSSIPVLSSTDNSQWAHLTHENVCDCTCDKSGPGEDAYEALKLISRLTCQKCKSATAKARRNQMRDDILPFEKLSKDTLCEETPIVKRKKEPDYKEVSIYSYHQNKKQDVKAVKQLTETMLQTQPEQRDAETSPIYNRRSVGILTSRSLLPKPHICYEYHYPETNPLDCVFVYDPPRCTVHTVTRDSSIQKGCMRDTVMKRKKREVSDHSVGLLTSCFGLQQCRHETQTMESGLMGEILSPKVYKTLYRSTKMLEKESNLMTDNGTETFGMISTGDDVIMPDDRCESTTTVEFDEQKYPMGQPNYPADVTRTCSNTYHARLLYLPPFYDPDPNQEHASKKSALGSYRYYSNLLSKQLVRVKENLKHLRTAEECVYHVSTHRLKTACTMIPSGRVELCCQTTKRQRSNTPLSRCVMAPSVTNISDGQDKKHLKSIYYMLTAIEGRIRRLKNNIQN